MIDDGPVGLTYVPHGVDQFGCELRTRKGKVLTLTGGITEAEPQAEGDLRLVKNPAIVHNAWGFAKHHQRFRFILNIERRNSHKAQAEAHAKVAVGIAEIVDQGLQGSAHGAWCSGCFALTGHLRVKQGIGTLRAYLCGVCGSPTLGCAAPSCRNMATRGAGSIRIPRYCAEHRHEIPGFEKATKPIPALEDYETFLQFDKRNLAGGSRVALGAVLSAGIVATGGALTAPAIGGAIGSLGTGLTGAAAGSYGLALLGGGSIAAGGLGIVGGTAVVTAAGGALGSALGASITTAYVGADKSFRIERLRDGVGTPVIVANGFLTEGTETRDEWENLVKLRYPTAPLYRVHWGSNELGALGFLVAKGLGQSTFRHGLSFFAARASKAAAGSLGPASLVLVAMSAIKNPWHTAKNRADKTGVVLADLIARTELDCCVLIGHSLGARAMATAAETLATKGGAPKVDTVHLLGAALGAKGDWRHLNDSVTSHVYNYHSANDKVLKFLYRTAQGGKLAAGLRGFNTKFPRIVDVDVSDQVDSHSEYVKLVELK